jgi:RNA polymerase sigma factor FliA
MGQTRPSTKSARATSGVGTSGVDELVTAHLPVVGHLVREMLARVPAHVRREDLFSAGSEALVNAARSFDPERGTPFSAFAALRIRGALLDELRGLDWASRSVRGKVRRIEAERDKFVAEHRRVPTAAELADRLTSTLARSSLWATTCSAPRC